LPRRMDPVAGKCEPEHEAQTARGATATEIQKTRAGRSRGPSPGGEPSCEDPTGSDTDPARMSTAGLVTACGRTRRHTGAKPARGPGSVGSPARAARRRRDSADDDPESSTARTPFTCSHTMHHKPQRRLSDRRFSGPQRAFCDLCARSRAHPREAGRFVFDYGVILSRGRGEPPVQGASAHGLCRNVGAA